MSVSLLPMPFFFEILPICQIANFSDHRLNV